MLLALLVFLCYPTTAPASRTAVEQGRYLFYAAGCAGCHNREQPLAGGSPVETPFGTFYTPNISPDPEYGIGSWTKEDFFRALDYGVSPSGESYFPAFPYTSYTRMTDSDKSALWSYLKSQSAVSKQNRPHELSLLLFSRKLAALWKMGHFTAGTYTKDPTKSPKWNRGAYLASAVGHCTECHTPRGPLGGLRNNFYLAGSRHGPEGGRVPNITPDPYTGIGRWSHEDLTTFLATGRRPDGSQAQGLMAEVLATSIMQLTDDDRDALATYLLALTPIRHDVASTPDPFNYDEEY